MKTIRLIVFAAAAYLTSAAVHAADPPELIGYCTWYLDFATKIGGQTSAQMRALADQWRHAGPLLQDPEYANKVTDGFMRASDDFGECLMIRDPSRCVREKAKAPGVRDRIAPCAKGPSP